MRLVSKYLLIAAVTVAPAAGQAFGPEDARQHIIAVGHCPLYYNVDDVNRKAFLLLETWLTEVGYAGGSAYDDGDTLTLRGIDELDIEFCLGLEGGTVTELEQNGADLTFASDTYIGFSFTTTTDSEFSDFPAGTYSFSMTGTDTTNDAPTADAGPDLAVASAETVTLDGTGSTDSDGTLDTYAWTQASGPSVVLLSASVESRTFTAPTLTSNDQSETLVFSLIVTDDDGATSIADTVTITVNPPADTTPPEAPTAANTSITTNLDGSITVSGTGAEPDATAQVTFPDGSVVTAVVAGNGTYSVSSGPSQPSGNVAIVLVDADGNDSAVLSQSFVAGPTVEQIQTEIATYMQDRAGLVIAAQPDLIGLLSGNATGSFNAAVTQGNGNFNFATSGGQPLWARIQGNWSDSGGRENSYFFGAAGAHINLSPDAIAGAMLQFDRLTQDNGDTRTEGDGYLVGPYFVARLPDQPLYFEGRYLFGETDNTTSIDGALGQDFETDRNLLSLKVAGQLSYGDLTLTPNLTAARLEDTQGAFTDNGGNAVAEQSITVTDVTVGLDFAKPLDVGNGSLIMTGGIAGIWSETNGDGFASTITPDFEGGRGRVHLGIAYTLSNGAALSAGASYDGIGTNDYESWGLNLGLEMKF